MRTDTVDYELCKHGIKVNEVKSLLPFVVSLFSDITLVTPKILDLLDPNVEPMKMRHQNLFREMKSLGVKEVDMLPPY